MTVGNQEERRSPRSKVFLSAELQWPDRNLTVVLRDLSEHGALVESPSPITMDSDVFFCRNELRVRGHVAWVRGKFAGISFGRPLKAEVVMRHITRPAPKPFDRNLHRRPGVTCASMSIEEQRLFDEMTRETARLARGL